MKQSIKTLCVFIVLLGMLQVKSTQLQQIAPTIGVQDGDTYDFEYEFLEFSNETYVNGTSLVTNEVTTNFKGLDLASGDTFTLHITNSTLSEEENILGYYSSGGNQTSEQVIEVNIDEIVMFTNWDDVRNVTELFLEEFVGLIQANQSYTEIFEDSNYFGYVMILEIYNFDEEAQANVTARLDFRVFYDKVTGVAATIQNSIFGIVENETIYGEVLLFNKITQIGFVNPFTIGDIPSTTTGTTTTTSTDTNTDTTSTNTTTETSTPTGSSTSEATTSQSSTSDPPTETTTTSDSSSSQETSTTSDQNSSTISSASSNIDTRTSTNSGSSSTTESTTDDDKTSSNSNSDTSEPIDSETILTDPVSISHYLPIIAIFVIVAFRRRNQ